ncbi:zinc finger protein OZF-like [Anopheles coustani]|uniref:zinc finger protein OZF-like n=1 Tax=Anopheles coustani TaxID=139045 RepID=UPI00265A0D38|nr:zinc finger protein OZF-like [Anopheles coustani]
MKSLFEDSCIFCLQVSSENAIEEVSYERFKEAIDFVFTFKILPVLEDGRRKVCHSCVECIMAFYDYATQVKKNQEAINRIVSEGEEQVVENNECSTNVEPPQTLIDSSSSVITISDESDSDCNDPVAFSNDELNAEDSSQLTKSQCDSSKQNVTETFSCPRCNESFRLKSFLAKHMKNHVDCSTCGISFTNRALMREHMREIHSKETTTICEMCGKLINKFQLKYHMEAFHIVKPVEIMECEFCSKKFNKLASLRSHIKAIHKEAGHSFPCDKCSNVYSSSRGLRGHKARVHVECRYCCNICNRQFKRKVNLNEHMAAHTGITLYECDVCGHGFNSNANMYAHIKRKHPVEWKEKNHERLMGRRRRLHRASEIESSTKNVNTHSS